jgi:quercetin dioxygenase-like cupin family protein
MRRHIPFLDTNAMPWAQLAPGLFSKMLSRDGESGARTALNRLVPAPDTSIPGKPHYHHTTEELLVVTGCMSFDSETWLTPGSYVFHPSETVHGFKSAVREETQFLSRVGRDLDFNWVEQPKQRRPYYVSPTPPHRTVTYIPEPQLLSWEPEPKAKGRVERAILSRDPTSGEGSMFMRYAPGASTPHLVSLPVYQELFVLDGELATEDGRSFGVGCYAFWPPTVTPRPELTARRQSLAYVNLGGWIGGT